MDKKEREELRTEIHNLNWFEIMDEAIKMRPTSWSERPIIEWRNATDEVCMSVIRALEKKGILTPFWEILKQDYQEMVTSKT